MRDCIVLFHPSTGLVTGKIVEGDEVIKELSFYLGKLEQQNPAHAEEMIRKRYGEWAKVNGVHEIEIKRVTESSLEEDK